MTQEDTVLEEWWRSNLTAGKLSYKKEAREMDMAWTLSIKREKGGNSQIVCRVECFISWLVLF
jgi:hypothetical protein